MPSEQQLTELIQNAIQDEKLDQAFQNLMDYIQENKCYLLAQKIADSELTTYLANHKPSDVTFWLTIHFRLYTLISQQASKNPSLDLNTMPIGSAEAGKSTLWKMIQLLAPLASNDPRLKQLMDEFTPVIEMAIAPFNLSAAPTAKNQVNPSALTYLMSVFPPNHKALTTCLDKAMLPLPLNQAITYGKQAGMTPILLAANRLAVYTKNINHEGFKGFKQLLIRLIKMQINYLQEAKQMTEQELAKNKINFNAASVDSKHRTALSLLASCSNEIIYKLFSANNFMHPDTEHVPELSYFYAPINLLWPYDMATTDNFNMGVLWQLFYRLYNLYQSNDAKEINTEYHEVFDTLLALSNSEKIDPNSAPTNGPQKGMSLLWLALRLAEGDKYFVKIAHKILDSAKENKIPLDFTLHPPNKPPILWAAANITDIHGNNFAATLLAGESDDKRLSSIDLNFTPKLQNFEYPKNLLSLLIVLLASHDESDESNDSELFIIQMERLLNCCQKKLDLKARLPVNDGKITYKIAEKPETLLRAADIGKNYGNWRILQLLLLKADSATYKESDWHVFSSIRPTSLLANILGDNFLDKNDALIKLILIAVKEIPWNSIRKPLAEKMIKLKQELDSIFENVILYSRSHERYQLHNDIYYLLPNTIIIILLRELDKDLQLVPDFLLENYLKYMKTEQPHKVFKKVVENKITEFFKAGGVLDKTQKTELIGQLDTFLQSILKKRKEPPEPIPESAPSQKKKKPG